MKHFLQFGLFAAMLFFLLQGVAAEEGNDPTADVRYLPEYNFQVSPLIPGKTEYFVVPGKSTPIGLLYHNSGTKKATIQTIAADIPDGWKLSTIPDLLLDSGHSKRIQVQLFVPAYVKPEKREVVSLLISTPNMDRVAQNLTLSIATRGSNIQDSDLDGISDTEEKNIGSDPFSPDTDRDGLFDGIEYEFAKNASETEKSFAILFQPQEETYADADNDGLSDIYEQTHRLDPQESDTDQDGYGDGLEAFSALEITPPLDWDDDGIPDALEKGRNAFDPNKTVASVKNLPQLPESKTIQTAETPPAILENTEEKNPKKSAADIIAEEKILSSQMPKEKSNRKNNG
jgi:hypothetical protein